MMYDLILLEVRSRVEFKKKHKIITIIVAAVVLVVGIFTIVKATKNGNVTTKVDRYVPPNKSYSSSLSSNSSNKRG